MEIVIDSLDRLPEAAAALLNAFEGHPVVAFHAPMGAGKTTLIAEICRLFGVDSIANSPSFSIINEYLSSSGRKIFHFDFYRLDSPAEALEIGVEDYFDSGCLCLIEWPEMIGEILPDDALEVYIEVDEVSGRRVISIPAIS